MMKGWEAIGKQLAAVKQLKSNGEAIVKQWELEAVKRL